MADISDYQEGIQAWKSGIDLVSTTMSGYTDYTPRLEGPDLSWSGGFRKNFPFLLSGKAVSTRRRRL